jgi:hypothetical protein
MAYVPVLGFIIAAIRTVKAQYAAHACFTSSHTMDCQPLYDATWQPFNDFSIATIVTCGLCVIAIITHRFLQAALRRNK